MRVKTHLCFAVVLVALDFYASFLLQARGAIKPDGNATLVGRFETIPSIAQVCASFTYI